MLTCYLNVATSLLSSFIYSMALLIDCSLPSLSCSNKLIFFVNASRLNISLASLHLRLLLSRFYSSSIPLKNSSTSVFSRSKTKIMCLLRLTWDRELRGDYLRFNYFLSVHWAEPVAVKSLQKTTKLCTGRVYIPLFVEYMTTWSDC